VLEERTDDLRRLEQLIAGTRRGAGRVMVIAGPAGIGKSALLDQAAATAATDELLVLSARASELEAGFAFGVATQLFLPALQRAGDEGRAALLAGPARRAGPALGIDTEPSPPDLHATLHGLHWLLADLAARRPVLITVDDAQWADDASARWLAYVARRLDALPVGIVVAVRTDPSGTQAEAPAGIGELHRSAVAALLTRERIVPAALSPDATRRLLADRLGRAPDAAFARACAELTGGNPFLLTELALELADAGVAPVAASVPRLGGVVPDRVGAWVRRRMAGLGPDAQALVEAVAILGSGAALPVAAAVAGLEEPEAAQAARALTSAQLLLDTAETRFRHPLLRTAVEAAIPAPERVVLHARAAALLAERGEPSGRIAAHLLAAGGGRGDQAAVGHLRAAAAAATADGLPEHAARLLRRALDEPVAAAARAAVLFELGTAESSAFAPAAAEHLRQALELADDPQLRADIALRLVLAEYQAGRNAAGVDVALAVIDEVRGRPELRDSWLMLEALLALVGRYDLAASSAVRGRIHDLAATLPGASAAERLVRSVAETERPGTSAADLVAATQRSIAVLDERPWPFAYRGIGEISLLLHADAAGEATAFADELVRRAQAAASPARHALAITARAMVALETGALAAAASDLDEAMATLRDIGELRSGDDGARSSPVGVAAARVQVHAERAEFEPAEALLSERGLDGSLPAQMTFNPLLYARGTLRLLAGRSEDAIADFEELGRRHAAWEVRRPSPPWRSSLALALVAVGRTEAAARHASDELALARAWGTPRSIARAMRAVALSGADDPIPVLREAEALVADGPWRLDRARVRCDLGAALRRAGARRDARASLSLALDEAHACGAEALARRAADELQRSGARPRRRALSGLDALTPSELRVAELAAAGSSNREIAQALFVSMPTVETHLTRAYRKLDVSGRGQLAGALTPAG
jgi:DNA-binding CsgD family transcriptional regulator